VSREQLPRDYDRKRTVMNMCGFSLHLHHAKFNNKLDQTEN